MGGEITGGVDMGAGSAASQNRVPTQNAVYEYARRNFVASFNGLTGAVGGVCAAQANTFTALQSFNSGVSANGGTFSVQLNAQNLRMLTVGGDEGGQIDFGLPATNTSLTGGVAIDVYQNRLRIFESGGTNRGVYIDLSGVSASVGTNLVGGGGGGAVSSVSGSGNGISVSPTTGAVVVQNTGVHSFNGATGAVTGASLGANTFTGLQSSATGFSGPLSGNATTATTATNSTQLGGVAAASYALLASPTFTGTPASTTAAVGTNTTQIATTAFVQNEIVADTVTSFNGRTGSVQGVSAAVAGDGISVSGATGSVTITNAGVTRAVAGTGISVNANTGTVTITNIGVQSFNGLTGAVGGVCAAVTNTFTATQSFAGGICMSVAGLQSSQTLTVNSSSAGITNAGFLYVGSGATFNSSLAVSTIVSPGATLTVLSGTSTTARTLWFNPYGQLIFEPQQVGIGVGGTVPKVVIQNSDSGTGQVQISGGNLYLGTRSDSEITEPSDIIFGNANNAFTTTLSAPNTATSNKTIIFPNQTGTVALTNGVVTVLNGISGGITLNAGSNVTITSSVAGGITIAASGGGGGGDGVTSFNGLTGAVTGTSVARHWFI